MRGEITLDLGKTFVLDDFTVIQVVAVVGDRVRYRVRAGLWRQKIALRTGRMERIVPRIRAEINGAFFPDVALPGLWRFERAAAETTALDAYLTLRAPTRPFAGES